VLLLVSTGYKLLGWVVNSSVLVFGFVIVQVKVGSSVFSMSDCNVVFYAVWQEDGHVSCCVCW